MAYKRWELERIHSAAHNAGVVAIGALLDPVDLLLVVDSCARLGDCEFAGALCADYLRVRGDRAAESGRVDRRLLEHYVESHLTMGTVEDVRRGLQLLRQEHGEDPEARTFVEEFSGVLFPASEPDALSENAVLLQLSGHSHDTRVQELCDKVRAALPVNLAKVQRLLQCDDMSMKTPIVRIVSEKADAEPKSAGAFGVEYHGNVQRPRVLLRAEPFLRGEWSIDDVLVHELVHQCQFTLLGPQWRSQPGWLVEGVAFWTQGGERTGFAEILRGQCGVRGESPWRALDAPLSASHREWDHARGCLMFQYLEKAYGRQAVDEFARRCVRNPDWRASLRAISRNSLDRLEEEFRAWASEWLARLDLERHSMLQVSRVLESQGMKEARRVLGGFLQEHSDSPFAAVARLDYVMACLRVDDVREAERALRECLKESWASHRNRRVAFASAMVALAKRDATELRRWADVVLDDVLGYSRYEEFTGPVISLLRAVRGDKAGDGVNRVDVPR